MSTNSNKTQITKTSNASLNRIIEQYKKELKALGCTEAVRDIERGNFELYTARRRLK